MSADNSELSDDTAQRLRMLNVLEKHLFEDLDAPAGIAAVKDLSLESSHSGCLTWLEHSHWSAYEGPLAQ